jgi:hypothetical protein
MLGLPTEAFKIRIVSGQIQSTLAGTNCNIKFAFDPEVSYDLNELISNVEFMWLSAQADSKIEFFKDSIRFAILEGQHEETIDPFFPALLKRAESIKRFLDKAGHSDRFLVRPKEIFEQEEALKWIQIVVEPGPHEVSTELAVDSTLASVKEPGLFANPVAFSSNGLHYIALCYWQATVEIAGQQVRAELGDCNIWSFVAIEDTDADNFRAIYNEYREFCAERADGTLLMRELEERGADRTSKEIDQK